MRTFDIDHFFDMILNHHSMNTLDNLLTKQLITSSSFLELRDCCKSLLLRNIMDCKSRKIARFADDLKSLINSGIIKNSYSTQNCDGRILRTSDQVEHKSLYIVKLGMSLEDMLLLEYNRALHCPHLPFSVKPLIWRQKQAIITTKHNVSRILSEILKESMTSGMVA